MKKLSLIYCFIVVLFTACNNRDHGVIEAVTPEEMQTLISADDVQLVDLRSQEERLTRGYIANSQHIDYNSDTFEEDILKLDKSKPVALYCHSGRRSAKCAEKLKAAGFVKVFDLQGGISEWKHGGLDLE
ncbi:rhodanese-like protein [Formosa agariphila KMM 3901]|uniref:Rhodanese-like protein n=1 Tax=Formosa agariphila (strain DSM 15362 / KCTC 12365 / LMG 23005 / KMM 3901 / M-2Alg 35-1) TaxID=1347342 RepID=T2KPS5_FORAG|nr:rhodanese-like domain-containing protein [Formosa agariphila]CDF80466.1 rhodanese-like protein [Formosa agariphila KMM 3901]